MVHGVLNNMCMRYSIYILDLIQLMKGRYTNGKEGATFVMMSNDYFFTSFGKLVKRGQN